MVIRLIPQFQQHLTPPTTPQRIQSVVPRFPVLTTPQRSQTVMSRLPAPTSQGSQSVMPHFAPTTSQGSRRVIMPRFAPTTSQGSQSILPRLPAPTPSQRSQSVLPRLPVPPTTPQRSRMGFAARSSEFLAAEHATTSVLQVNYCFYIVSYYYNYLLLYVDIVFHVG